MRKITIGRRFVKNSWSESFFPKCTLAGAWLRAAGFEIGDKVVVVVEKGKVTITKEPL